MPTECINEEMGLEYTIPDVTTRELNKLYAAERKLRREYTRQAVDAHATVFELLRIAVTTILEAKVKPSDPEFTGRLNSTATTLINAVIVGHPEDLTAVESNSLFVKAAADIGWMGEIAPDDIDDWPPYKADWAVVQVRDAIIAARTVPKN